MAVTSSNDDGFREIQLSGKQLVFLFMAVTVVLVVTFLTGVLVGRGVRAERTEAAHADATTDAPPTPSRAPSTAGDVGGDPREVPPPPQPEDESPAAKAGDDEPPVAVKRGAPADTPATPQPKPAESPTKGASAPAPAPAKTPAPPAPAPVKPAPPAAPAPATTATANGASAPPPAPPAPAAAGDAPRSGYAVQVVAVNVRGDADAIAKRLSGKGYSAYVEVPKGSTSMFRVRVGTFKTRREAQTVADRLKKEEKFKPWVTR